MTKAQKRLIKKLQEHPDNRIIEFVDHLETVRYALQFWENGETDYVFPDPRTVRSLLSQGVLDCNGSDVIVLSPEERAAAVRGKYAHVEIPDFGGENGLE